MGVFDGMPNGQRVRMKHDICLTTESCIPKESIALTVDTGRTTYHMLMIFGDEQSARIGFGGLDEELVVGDITLWLEPMVLTQQMGKGLEVFVGLYLARSDTTGIGIVDALLHLLVDAFFGRPAME